MAFNEPLYPRLDPLDRTDHRYTFNASELLTDSDEEVTAKMKQPSALGGRRANVTNSPVPIPSSGVTSQRSSFWSRPIMGSDDELYYLTDNESVEVPLICSDSVKKTAEKMRKTKYPSLYIPSPSYCPLPPGARALSAESIGITPASKTAPSPARLAAFDARRHRRIPTWSSTPSLDDSPTSEELAASSDSCPSTPDRGHRSPASEDWEPPAQLGSEAIELLKTLAPDMGDGPNPAQLGWPIDALQEMSQIVRLEPTRRQMVPGSELKVPKFTTNSEPVSALTIPSPGGFFASLHTSTRATWCVSASPSTGTAEQFYGVPWRTNSRANSPSRTLGLGLHAQRAATPPIHQERRLSFSPTDDHAVDAIEISESAFQAAARHNSVPQSERTKHWLYAQWLYMSSAVVETPNAPKQLERQITPAGSPGTPSPLSMTVPSNSLEVSPPRKAVRLESVPESEEASFTPPSAAKEPLFYQGFEAVLGRLRRRDAIVHSQARVEAAHVSSSSLPHSHIARLRGTYELHSPDRPQPSRPISALVPTPTEENHSKLITMAERERQALTQLLPTIHTLHATSHLVGSTIIASPIIKHLRTSSNRRILDYGGAPNCDWGWAVALQFRHAEVVTIPHPASSTASSMPHLAGPPNHIVALPDTLTRLPFPDSSFDLISARSLHVLLRTRQVDGAGSLNTHRDEFDAVLAEFHRVLKPGGHVEFSLLDAEMLHAPPLAQALGVEFAFTLRQRGYDPQASRYFLPRLRQTGFDEVKRAWVVLPAADVVPKWVDKGKMGAHGRKDSAASASAGKADEAEGPKGSMRYYEGERGRNSDSGHGHRQVYEPPLVGSTAEVKAMTGLVGARAWEKWILKLQREVGGSDERMLERVNRALEEAGRVKAGWRCLLGWARKGG